MKREDLKAIAPVAFCAAHHRFKSRLGSQRESFAERGKHAT
jgi:hypothetical protein